MTPGADPFVGRSWERRELGAAIAAGTGGRGELVLVSGEPGIGKTRLVREAVAEATTAGCKTVWAACWNGEDAPPYWPWVQLVRRLGAVGAPAGPADTRIPGPAASDPAIVAAGVGLDRDALTILVPELGSGAPGGATVRHPRVVRRQAAM